MGLHFFSLEKLMNLHDGYRKVFKIDHFHLLLIQISGELHLLESHCPHRGHPLSESDVMENRLRCPLHGYLFDIPSGTLIYKTEESCRNLKIYEPVYQGQEVGVWL